MQKIICGNCFNALPEDLIDLVVTSPPYAQQRASQYGGIPEKDYPAWTVKWMQAVRPLLKITGSVAIVIRPHIHQHVISDYVLKTRLALREYGWDEAEELIWTKPDAPPMGHIRRPRRSWESILWFAKDASKVFCDPKANGNLSKRIGMETTKGVGDWKAGVSKAKEGIARCRDYVEVGTGQVDKSKENTHPAQYPEALARWIVKLLCPKNGRVLDPFMGSGSTLVACAKLGIEATGIEISEIYCDIAKKRLIACVKDATTEGLSQPEYSSSVQSSQETLLTDFSS